MQQWMPCLPPIDKLPVFKRRVNGAHFARQPGFRTKKIHESQEAVSLLQIGYEWPDISSQFKQNTVDLAAFLIFKLTDLIIGFKNVRRFYENGLPCCRFVVDKPAQFPLVLGGNRNYHT